MRLPIIILTPVLSVVLCGTIVAQDPSLSASKAREGAREAPKEFIQAFKVLDWDAFRASFSDDATVFFPFAGAGKRATGREEVEAAFSAAFERIRRTRAGPPYLNIDPKDMHVQVLGEAAVVTFHLGVSEALGRRTIVFRRRGDRWLIVHIHASQESRPQ